MTVLEEVAQERLRQDRMWGEQNHDPFTWLAILGEEVGEANRAALEAVFWERYGMPDHPLQLASHYREELIQVAAVATAMVECLDRNGTPDSPHSHEATE
jgi:NTP pyrophosphatase (non-canonical NTP hydrolase)